MIVHKSNYKRNYKYSHPLAGKLYDNQRFVNHCSSYLDSEFKLSTTTADDPPSHPTSSSQKRHSQYAEVASKNTTYRVRNSQSVADNRLLCDPTVKISERQHNKTKGTISQGMILHETSDLMSFMALNSNFKRNSIPESKDLSKGLRNTQKISLKHKLAMNSFEAGIRIINTITSIKEVESRSIPISFEKIFKKLIRTQLMGEFSLVFLQKLEHYIKIIVQNNEMYENPCGIKLQQSYKTISRKDELLDAIYQLQMQGQQAKIQQIIKYYCIPSHQTNKTLLSDLLKGIVMELYEKKNCPKNIQYCLLTEQGQKIIHISQIYFSTKYLLIAPEVNLQKTLEQYKKMLEDHDKELRMTFKQSVKHDFIHKIVYNQVEDKMVNYTQRPKQLNLYRKQIVEQAQSYLVTKSKKRLQQKRTNINQSFVLSCNSNISFTQPKGRLWSNYARRKSQQRKQYKEIISKLQKILDPNNKYYVKSKLDQKTQQQFIKLHRLNDQYDITYTHNEDNSNKLLLINFMQNCHIFTSKTSSQLARIMDMLNKLYFNGAEIKQIYFWQFKEIYETAHGVSDHSTIMKFVLTYLGFDEYGEVARGAVYSLVQCAVSCQGRSLQLIKSIVWDWLELFGLIQNEVLRKQSLQIWYQPVKVVYLLFLSIIFGCEYKDLEEMRADVLRQQPQ